MPEIYGLSYEVKRSSRKTLNLSIRQDGSLLVRAPHWLPESEIRRFLLEKQEWVRKNVLKVRKAAEAADAAELFSAEEMKEMARRAAEVIPEKVAFYSRKIGVTYGRITIRCQKTRWGSCSSKGNLNFNCLLMKVPPEVLDSVVVHELCHRKEMSHSARFYTEVLRVFPEYRRWERWLKENGGALMARVPR
ncbi:MAG: M48 family metallopeptidase [Oscillospiraceae bacterium]|nr:M48 family metallopeptidase [Oscillospiraceae bacterium]